MKSLLFIFLLFPLVLLGQSDEYEKMLKQYYDGFPTITAQEALKKIGGNTVVFLDTRETTEFDIGHIEGALCVGYDHFSLASVESINKSKEIIVYCSIGARSQNIGKRLKKAGFTNVKNLYGGLFHWSNEELPMVDRWNKSTRNIHGYSKEWGKWVTKGNVVY